MLASVAVAMLSAPLVAASAMAAQEVIIVDGHMVDERGNSLGRNAQYGTLLFSTYLIFGGGGKTRTITNNFRQVISNPCPAGGNQY